MTGLRTWDDVRRALEARKAELNAEIGAYPPPITGCDAQFNHLIAERQALGRELDRMKSAQKGAMSLESFVGSCSLLGAIEGGNKNENTGTGRGRDRA